MSRSERYLLPLLIFIFAGAVHGSISGIAGVLKFHATGSQLQESIELAVSFNRFFTISFLLIAVPIFFHRRFLSTALNFLYILAGYILCSLTSMSLSSSVFSALTLSPAFDNLKRIFGGMDFTFVALSGLLIAALYALLLFIFERRRGNA